MWLKAEKAKIDRSYFMQFQGYEKDCAECRLRKRCLRDVKQITPRQINVKLGQTEESKDNALTRMKQKIDSNKDDISTANDWERGRARLWVHNRCHWYQAIDAQR